MATAEKKPAKVTLPKDIFAVDVPNHELLKLTYDAFLANSRLASATTKTRGEVRGGGKKPWRQKGTGRARFGSTRNPIWRTGGIVFGPSGNENYTIKISKTSKRVAIRQALTLASEAGKISVEDISSTGKTKQIATFLDSKKLHADTKFLLVVDEKTPELIRATNNLSNVLLISAKYLAVYYILNADSIIMTPQALTTISDWLGGYKK